MSTSHYSNGNYEPIKSSNPHPALISPSRTDDYPEIPEASGLSRHSRPAQTDVGSQTMRIPLPIHYSASRRGRQNKALWLFIAGLALTVVDGVCLAFYADMPIESVILAALSMIAGGFITAVAVSLVKY